MASSDLALRPISIRNIVVRGLGGSSTGTALKPIQPVLSMPIPLTVVSAYMGEIKLSRSVVSHSFRPISLNSQLRFGLEYLWKKYTKKCKNYFLIFKRYFIIIYNKDDKWSIHLDCTQPTIISENTFRVNCLKYQKECRFSCNKSNEKCVREDRE